MRHLAILCAALLAAAAPLCAQEHGLGVKGGLNIATQDISGGGSSLDSRYGAVFGVFYTLPLGWIGLQAEGLYSQKGARVKAAGSTSTLVLDYFEVPVLARLRFGAARRHFFVAGGPSTGFRIKAKGRTEFSGSTEEIDLADQVKQVDFGIAAGGGMEIGSLVIDGRYTFGLTDIDKDAGTRTKNRVVSVTAGFRF
jgi:hypothetical protein